MANQQSGVGSLSNLYTSHIGAVLFAYPPRLVFTRRSLLASRAHAPNLAPATPPGR
jgi:hypothetical protein